MTVAHSRPRRDATQVTSTETRCEDYVCRRGHLLTHVAYSLPCDLHGEHVTFTCLMALGRAPRHRRGTQARCRDSRTIPRWSPACLVDGLTPG